MGVGDTAVPKRMKKLGEAFYGRAHAYDAALDAGDEDALAAALGRNVIGQEAPARPWRVMPWRPTGTSRP